MATRRPSLPLLGERPSWARTIERSVEVSDRAIAVRATPVPSALHEIGVRIGKDEESGYAIVVIPKGVRAKTNVLDPVQSFAQADPNWTPSLRLVELDPDAVNGPHFYKQAGAKLAPTKQGLELLAKAAGVLYTRTRRIAREDLAEGERFGYVATIGVRRYDGSIEELERSKTFVEEVEQQKIQDAVTSATNRDGGGPRFPEGPARLAEIRKRWLAELEHGAAKTESKAVLRAIRAALQIPHTFTPARAALPFLVIGYSFTPDYSEPETRRLLIAAGLNAQAAIYGSESRSSDVVDVAGPAVELEAGEPAEPRQELEAAAPEEEPVEAEATEVDETPAAELGSFEMDDDEPGGKPEPAKGSDFAPPADVQAKLEMQAAKASKHLVAAGNQAGKSLGQIAADEDKGAEWFEWALTKALGGSWDAPEAAKLKAAVVTFGRFRYPELYTKAGGQ